MSPHDIDNDIPTRLTPQYLAKKKTHLKIF